MEEPCENPLTTYRNERGLSRTQAAVALGVSYVALSQAETGQSLRLGRSVRAALARQGEDPDAYAAAYARWREQRGAAMRGA